MMYTIPEEPTKTNHLVMYFIVRDDLNMSAGKVGVQCAHAAQMILFEYFNMEKGSESFPALDQPEAKVMRMQYWLQQSDKTGMKKFVKIAYGADAKEFQKIKDQLEPITVKDAGLTEIEPGTETVMVFYPLYKDERPKLLKRLQLLK